MVFEKNGFPAHTGGSDMTSPPTAFELIQTGYDNEYLIRKYDEDKLLTYESPSQPTYVDWKTKDLDKAMSDEAFLFNILLEGANVKRIRHVKTGMYLKYGANETVGRHNSVISFQNRTSENVDHWGFKHNFLECEVGETFERNHINTYGVYDQIEFPAKNVSRILFDFWIIF